EKRLEIRKCNGRLNPGKTQREPTFQVVLDALALTPCYCEFLTTADVLEVYMHQLWDSIHKHDTSYRSLSGKTIGLDKLRCSRAQILWGMYYKKNVDYVELLWEDFTYQINNRVTPPKKARKLKKPASPKLMTVPASPKEPTKKSERVKRPAKKSTNAPTKGVVIRDTPSVSILKKKAPAKADRGKGNELLLDAALLEDAQLKKAL
ncbi:hypothetical protein Tco_1496600, partial [Tanacetum coccineum]